METISLKSQHSWRNPQQASKRARKRTLRSRKIKIRGGKQLWINPQQLYWTRHFRRRKLFITWKGGKSCLKLKGWIIHWWRINLKVYSGWRRKKNEEELVDEAQPGMDWEGKCQEEGRIKKRKEEVQEKDPNKARKGHHWVNLKHQARKRCKPWRAQETSRQLTSRTRKAKERISEAREVS